MIEEMLIQNADKGFAYAIGIFLLWKGYTQDKEYMKVLIELKNEISKCKVHS